MERRAACANDYITIKAENPRLSAVPALDARSAGDFVPLIYIYIYIYILTHPGPVYIYIYIYIYGPR